MRKIGIIEIHGIYYRYEAKVYDEDSKYGINGSRLSKLNVKVGVKCLIHYDRGWIIRPNESNADLMNVYHQILKKVS